LPCLGRNILRVQLHQLLIGNAVLKQCTFWMCSGIVITTQSVSFPGWLLRIEIAAHDVKRFAGTFAAVRLHHHGLWTIQPFNNVCIPCAQPDNHCSQHKMNEQTTCTLCFNSANRQRPHRRRISAASTCRGLSRSTAQMYAAMSSIHCRAGFVLCGYHMCPQHARHQCFINALARGWKGMSRPCVKRKTWT
jgi:hypothetical protein